METALSDTMIPISSDVAFAIAIALWKWGISLSLIKAYFGTQILLPFYTLGRLIGQRLLHRTSAVNFACHVGRDVGAKFGRGDKYKAEGGCERGSCPEYQMLRFRKGHKCLMGGDQSDRKRQVSPYSCTK